MNVWVKLLSPIELSGQLVPAGDWLPMTRPEAKQRLIRGQIEIPRPDVLQTVQELTDCAFVLIGANQQLKQKIRTLYPGVPIVSYTKGCPEYGRFLLWDISAKLRLDLILVGFQLLKKWQLAVPLGDYNTLAEDIGTEKGRREAKEIVKDLRVPIYDSRVMFVRQCPETRNLFDLWGGGGQLKFLEALYQSRPIVNALPPIWIYDN